MRIRHATSEDLDELAALEALCFPASEAATREQIAERLAVLPYCYWLAVDRGRPDDVAGGPERIVAYVGGVLSSCRDLTDDLLEDASRHEPDGDWLMLCGVATRPGRRREGIAASLLRAAIDQARDRGRHGAVLTCKEHLLGWYAGLGFVNEGLSGSKHGGAIWYQMRLTF